MNLPITSFLYSVEDRSFMLGKLAILEQGAFSTKQSFEEQVHEQFSLPVAEALLHAMTEANIASSSAPAVQKFIKAQIETVKSLPVVRLRVAFNPSNDMVKNISKWLDLFSSDKMLVEVIVDPAVIGGVAIELDGTYSDYSLKKLLQEKLSLVDQKNTVPQHQ